MDNAEMDTVMEEEQPAKLVFTDIGPNTTEEVLQAGLSQFAPVKSAKVYRHPLEFWHPHGYGVVEFESAEKATEMARDMEDMFLLLPAGSPRPVRCRSMPPRALKKREREGPAGVKARPALRARFAEPAEKPVFTDLKSKLVAQRALQDIQQQEHYREQRALIARQVDKYRELERRLNAATGNNPLNRGEGGAAGSRQ
eukprot:jgi/Mesvir1/29654/Mv21496-RA.1